jgi:hypothetical protein
MKPKKLYVLDRALPWESVRITGIPVKVPKDAPSRWLAAFSSKRKATQWAKVMGYPADFIEMEERVDQ